MTMKAPIVGLSRERLRIRKGKNEIKMGMRNGRAEKKRTGIFEIILYDLLPLFPI